LLGLGLLKPGKTNSVSGMTHFKGSD